LLREARQAATTADTRLRSGGAFVPVYVASKVADQLQFVLTHTVMNAVRAFAFVN
jgi:hypothetical protein